MIGIALSGNHVELWRTPAAICPGCLLIRQFTLLFVHRCPASAVTCERAQGLFWFRPSPMGSWRALGPDSPTKRLLCESTASMREQPQPEHRRKQNTSTESRCYGAALAQLTGEAGVAPKPCAARHGLNTGWELGGRCRPWLVAAQAREGKAL